MPDRIEEAKSQFQRKHRTLKRDALIFGGMTLVYWALGWLGDRSLSSEPPSSVHLLPVLLWFYFCLSVIFKIRFLCGVMDKNSWTRFVFPWGAFFLSPWGGPTLFAWMVLGKSRVILRSNEKMDEVAQRVVAEEERRQSPSARIKDVVSILIILGLVFSLALMAIPGLLTARAHARVELLMKEGRTLLDQGRFAEASQRFEEITRQSSIHPEAYRYWGTSLYRAGRFEESARAFQKFIETATEQNHRYQQILKLPPPHNVQDFEEAREYLRKIEEKRE